MGRKRSATAKNSREMPPAVRDQLAELAKKRKEADPLRERRSLKGLPPQGLGFGLDRWMQGDIATPAELEPREDGSIRYVGGMFQEYNRDDGRNKPTLFGVGLLAREHYEKAQREYVATNDRCAWVRVMYARADQLENFALILPTRYLRLRTWHRETQSFVDDRVPVFQAAGMLAVFAAIWPEADGPKLLGRDSPGGDALSRRLWFIMSAKYLRGFCSYVADYKEWKTNNPNPHTK